MNGAVKEDRVLSYVISGAYIQLEGKRSNAEAMRGCNERQVQRMGLKIMGHKLVILFLLFSISTFTCLEINRVTYGGDIDSKRGSIYRSQDSFTNIEKHEEDCARRNSSCSRDSCSGSTCCKCKCNEGLTFFSYRYGCLSSDDISLRSSRQCNYKFYYQIVPVVPAIKNRHSLLSAAAGRLDVRSNLISLSDNRTKCNAKSVNEITSTGSTILLDLNANSEFFEVRHERSSPTDFKGIAVNDYFYSTWEKLEGRLISLDISCVNSASKTELSSCLLFIVNGTSFDCDQVYCIDRASGSCESGWHCCTCICDKSAYPFADQQNKKCVAFRVTTSTAPPTPTTTRAVDVTFTEAPTTNPTTFRTGTSTKETNQNTTDNSFTTEAALNNSTIVPIKTERGSTPVGAIVGGVLGAIFVILLILVLYMCYKKRRDGSAKETSKAQIVENGNEVSSYPRDSMREDGQQDCSENPYYKRASGDASANDYFSPTAIINDGGVYYSSIDALKQQKDPKQFEYSYARGMKKDPEAADQSQYQSLGQSKYEPDTYQALDTGINNTPKKDSLTQENPYYVPSAESDGLMKENITDANKGLSLKNNLGSLEDVSVVYEAPLKDTEQEQYQGLTIPPGKNQYQPLEQNEYQDMSYNNKSDGEYMYAAP